MFVSASEYSINSSSAIHKNLCLANVSWFNRSNASLSKQVSPKGRINLFFNLPD
jgi:hypothetical protein